MLLVAAVALPTQAADPEYYGGIMLGVTGYEQSGVGFNMTSATARLGYQVSRAIALEGRLGGASPGQGSAGNSGYTYRIDAMGSVLAKLSWQPWNDTQAYLHALFGATAARTNTTSPGAADQTNSLHGGSYGFGVDLFADQTRALNIEWMRYLHGKVAGSSNTYTINSVGVGYLQRF
jgi:hypothetical protein